jgi:hypothetical protein
MLFFYASFLSTMRTLTYVRNFQCTNTHTYIRTYFLVTISTYAKPSGTERLRNPGTACTRQHFQFLLPPRSHYLLSIAFSVPQACPMTHIRSTANTDYYPEATDTGEYFCPVPCVNMRSIETQYSMPRFTGI